MMRRAWLALFFSIVVSALAQPVEPDTLEQHLERATAVLKQTPRISIKLAHEALEIADRQNNRALAAEAHLVLGKASLTMHRNDEALEHLTAALEMFQSEKESDKVAEVLQGIGIVYEQLGEPKMALEYLRQALNLFQDIGNLKGIARVHVSLGIHYWNRKEYAKAVVFYKEALKYQKELDDPVGYAATLSNIATIHQIQEEYDRAIALYKEVISLGDKHGSSRGLAIAYGNMGEAYLKKGELKPAEDALLKSMELAESVDAPDVTVATMDNLVALRKQQGRLEEALQLKEKQDAIRQVVMKQQSSEKAELLRGELELGEKEAELDRMAVQVLAQQETIAKLRLHQTVLLVITVMLLIALLSMLLIIRSCVNGLPGSRNGEKQQEADRNG